MTTTIFELASRTKLRIPSTKGDLSIEDLWELSLTALDRLAVSTDKKLESLSPKSFIGRPTNQNKETTLQLEILKRIIEVKLEEREVTRKKVETKAQTEFLNDLLKEKHMEEMKGLSVEEINKKLDELKA